jgi:hypothetical protein
VLDEDEPDEDAPEELDDFESLDDFDSPPFEPLFAAAGVLLDDELRLSVR